MNKKNKNYIANFDNLVDLVDDHGDVKFLVLEDVELELKSNVLIDGLNVPGQNASWPLL